MNESRSACSEDSASIVVEESDEDLIQANAERDFAKKAKMLPTTFVIKARKL